MKRSEQISGIEDAAGRVQSAVPDNVMLRGDGKFVGSFGNDRNRLLTNEEILKALFVAEREMGIILTLTTNRISEEG